MNKNLTFLIYSPEYSDRWGGVLVLHKLAKILSETYQVYITSQTTFSESKAFKISGKTAETILLLKPDTYVIYPEIIIGNPLNAKNVIRWVLYYPGLNGGEMSYADNEIVFCFNKKFVKNTQYENANLLHVFESKLEKFKNLHTNRNTNSFLIKKGHDKFSMHQSDAFLQNIHNGILLDNILHQPNLDEELVKIFNSSEYFVSYDATSYHSVQAALCGAISIVIPDPHMTREEFFEYEPLFKYGVAYGIEDINWAEETASFVYDNIKELERKSAESVKNMIKLL
jgi:hypothetical protein